MFPILPYFSELFAIPTPLFRMLILVVVLLHQPRCFLLGILEMIMLLVMGLTPIGEFPGWKSQSGDSQKLELPKRPVVVGQERDTWGSNPVILSKAGG